MPDGSDRLIESELASTPPRPDTADPYPNRQRLLVVTPPAHRAAPREGRQVANLGAVFSRFAEVQSLVGEQMVALDEAVEQQGQQLTEVAAQLPDMKERINWLIASYYEDDRETQAIRERLARQEAGLAALTEAVRGLCEAQEQWKETIGQLLQVLGRVQPPSIEPPPRWRESLG